MRAARSGRLTALARRGALGAAAVALLALVFQAWLDPALTLSLADGLFLCR
ncbi:hypothetical protein [Bordetella genomosp. 13]|uniref:hypothetical protein n=1 Tax=Bordetella genomosp. 13 TaxID=463040 RepID=UPI001643358F|nr:hypothetical protein [Bordetella genomosp. 13]